MRERVGGFFLLAVYGDWNRTAFLDYDRFTMGISIGALDEDLVGSCHQVDAYWGFSWWHLADANLCPGLRIDR